MRRHQSAIQTQSRLDPGPARAFAAGSVKKTDGGFETQCQTERRAPFRWMARGHTTLNNAVSQRRRYAAKAGEILIGEVGLTDGVVAFFSGPLPFSAKEQRRTVVFRRDARSLSLGRRLLRVDCEWDAQCQGSRKCEMKMLLQTNLLAFKRRVD